MSVEMPAFREGEDPALTMIRNEMARRVASSKDLLTKFASLTHRLDRIAESRSSAAIRDTEAAEVRAQRDAIEAEILRRMTTQRSPRDIPCRTCGAGMDDRCYGLNDDAQSWGPHRVRHYHTARVQDAER